MQIVRVSLGQRFVFSWGNLLDRVYSYMCYKSWNRSGEGYSGPIFNDNTLDGLSRREKTKWSAPRPTGIRSLGRSSNTWVLSSHGLDEGVQMRVIYFCIRKSKKKIHISLFISKNKHIITHFIICIRVGYKSQLFHHCVEVFATTMANLLS